MISKHEFKIRKWSINISVRYNNKYKIIRQYKYDDKYNKYNNKYKTSINISGISKPYLIL